MKSEYDEKAKLCYMDTDSFIACIKTDDVYKDVAENDGTRFDISNYELEGNSTERKKFVGLRAKVYGYLIDQVVKIKKQKASKSVP